MIEHRDESPTGATHQVADAGEPYTVSRRHHRAAALCGPAQLKQVHGLPLGYFLSLHGLVLIAVVTVASFVNRQDAIDHWHGAHEDT